MRPTQLRLVGGLVLICALLAGFSALPPLDYRFFSGAARVWLAGESRLYDANVEQFYYAPWSLFILVPLAPLPDNVGKSILNLCSLLGVWWAARSLGSPRSPRAALIASAAAPTISILLLGQWDGLILGGLALAWHAIQRRQPWLLGLALALIGTKPTNALLLSPVLLYGLHAWPWPRLLRAAVIPLVALISSFLACGWDWPLRYLTYIRTGPPLGYDISLWKTLGLPSATLLALGVVGALAWLIAREGLSAERLALTLLASMIISPFVTPYHYVATVPALALVLSHNRRIGLALWGFVMIALVAFLGRWADWPHLAYLGGLTIAAFAAMWPRRATQSPDTPSAPLRSR